MRLFYLYIVLLLVTACQKAPNPNDLNTPDNLGGPVSPYSPVGCDTCKYPVVMIHGFLASGDTYTPFHQLFTSNGYKMKQLYAFDWNSLNQTANHVATLNTFIDKVLLETGATQVALMGHSAGGGLSYNYLSDATRAAKVAHYVHIGSGAQPGPAGPGGIIPTLNLWSPDDAVAAGADIPGAVNVSIPGKDHYQIATSKESFAAVYNFFHGGPPATLEVTLHSPVCIAGKVLTFGENQPQLNAKVEVFQVDPLTGMRLSDTPDYTFMTNADGFWGPKNVPENVNYEFKVTPPNGTRTVYYYREGFIHLNPLVYLRTIPPPPSLAGLLLAGLPNNNTQSVLNVFSASQAIVQPQDTLLINNTLVSTPAYASPEKTAIAWFFYDDGDNNTELIPVGLFGSFPFLNGVDYYFPTATPTTISIKMNDRSLNIPNRKSSDGVMVAVFD